MTFRKSQIPATAGFPAHFNSQRDDTHPFGAVVMSLWHSKEYDMLQLHLFPIYVLLSQVIALAVVFGL